MQTKKRNFLETYVLPPKTAAGVYEIYAKFWQRGASDWLEEL